MNLRRLFDIQACLAVGFFVSKVLVEQDEGAEKLEAAAHLDDRIPASDGVRRLDSSPLWWAGGYKAAMFLCRVVNKRDRGVATARVSST